MSRQTQFFDIGVQGRKTGIQVPTQERDAHGLENPEGFFTPSPAPQKPLNAFLTGTQGHGAGAGAGAATGSPAPVTTTGAASKLQVPEVGDVTISGEETMDLDSGPGSGPAHRHSSPAMSTNPTLNPQRFRARSPFRPPIKELSTSDNNPVLSTPPRRASSLDPSTPNPGFTPVNPRQPSTSPTRSIPESSSTTANINRVLNFQSEGHGGGILNSPVITGQPARRPRTPSVPPPAKSALQAKALRRKEMALSGPATQVEKKSGIEPEKNKDGELISSREEDGSPTALPIASNADGRRVIEKEKAVDATTSHGAGGIATATSATTNTITAASANVSPPTTTSTSTSKSAPITSTTPNQETIKSKPAPAAVPKKVSQPLAARKKKLLSSRPSLLSSRAPLPFSLSDDDNEEGDISMETGRAAAEDEDMEDIDVGISGKKWKAPKPAAPAKAQPVTKPAAKVDTKKASVAEEKSGKGKKKKPRRQVPEDSEEDEVEQEAMVVEEEVGELEEAEEEEAPVPVPKGSKKAAPPARKGGKTNQAKAAPKTVTAPKYKKGREPTPVDEGEEIDEAQEPGPEPAPTPIPIRQKKLSRKEPGGAKAKAETEAATAAAAKASRGKKGRKVQEPAAQDDEDADEAVPPPQPKQGGAAANTTTAVSSSSIPSSSAAAKSKQTRGKKAVSEPEPEPELMEQEEVPEKVVPKGRRAGKKSKEVPFGTAEEIPKAATTAKKGKGGGRGPAAPVNMAPEEDHKEMEESDPVPETKGKGKNAKSQGKGKAKAVSETEGELELAPVGRSKKTSKTTTKATTISKAGKTNTKDKANTTTTATKGRRGSGKGKGKAADQDDDEEMPDADSDAAAASSQLAQEASANNSHVYSDDEDQHDDASPSKRLRRAAGASSTVASSSTNQRPKSSLSKPQSKSLSPDHLPPPRGGQKVSIAPLTAPEISPSDTNKRRSARARIAPLSFWNGEKVLTTVVPTSKETRRRDGNDAAAKIEVRKEVVRVEVVDDAKRRAKSSKTKVSRARSGSAALKDDGEPVPRGKKRKRGTKVQRSQGHDEENDGNSTASDVESDLEPWEEGEGCFKGMVKARDGSGEMVEEIIAYSSHSMITNAVASSSFKMNKTISLDHLGTGIIEIPSGGQKRWKPSGKFDLVFYVIKGKVWVAVGDNSFTIRKGGQFQVAKGNLYTIENHFAPTAKLFFVQGCDNSS